MKNPTYTSIAKGMDDAIDPVICDPRVCFENALAVGTLSPNPGHTMYVGDFMYMFSKPTGNGAHLDSFKNITRRNYVTAPRMAN